MTGDKFPESDVQMDRTRMGITESRVRMAVAALTSALGYISDVGPSPARDAAKGEIEECLNKLAHTADALSYVTKVTIAPGV